MGTKLNHFKKENPRITIIKTWIYDILYNVENKKFVKINTTASQLPVQSFSSDYSLFQLILMLWVPFSTTGILIKENVRI